MNTKVKNNYLCKINHDINCFVKFLFIFKFLYHILFFCLQYARTALAIWFRFSNYASPSSGEAYRDRRLAINFELWVEIFCVPTCFHVRIPKPCLFVCPSVRTSVCPHPEKRNHHSFVNISPTLVIDTSI